MKSNAKKIVIYLSSFFIFYATIILFNLKFSKKENKSIDKYEKLNSLEFISNLSYQIITDDELEEKFYLENIPNEYADAFLYYTNNKKSIRPYFYALMLHESCNFKYFIHKNSDGSYDKGPSQLNTNNIKNPKFIEYYSPKDTSHITSIYCYYMVMSINFYWDLVNKYGYDYAFYAYNGGERTVKLIKNKSSQNASLIKAVKDYDNKVRYQMEKANLNLTNYINNKRSEHINNLFASFNIYNTPITFNQSNNKNISLEKINKLRCNEIFYIRREDLLQFEIKEGIVVGQTIIRTLNI